MAKIEERKIRMQQQKPSIKPYLKNSLSNIWLQNLELRDGIEESGYFYGKDQMYNTHPIVFPTLTVVIDSEFSPFFAVLENLMNIGGGENIWYLGFSEQSPYYTDTCLICYAITTKSGNPAEQDYYVDISEEQQAILFDVFDKELKKRTGMGIKQHLKIGHARMLRQAAEEVKK